MLQKLLQKLLRKFQSEFLGFLQIVLVVEHLDLLQVQLDLAALAVKIILFLIKILFV